MSMWLTVGGADVTVSMWWWAMSMWQLCDRRPWCGRRRRWCDCVPTLNDRLHVRMRRAARKYWTPRPRTFPRTLATVQRNGDSCMPKRWQPVLRKESLMLYLTVIVIYAWKRKLSESTGEKACCTLFPSFASTSSSLTKKACTFCFRRDAYVTLVMLEGASTNPFASPSQDRLQESIPSGSSLPPSLTPSLPLSLSLRTCARRCLVRGYIEKYNSYNVQLQLRATTQWP